MSTQLGKYRLVRRLGAGGMGEVWEAVDTVLDRTVAVKLLTGPAADNADVVREAAAAARVHHPNVVALYDAAEAAGRWFLVMEYIAGTSAAQRVTEAVRLPWPEATRIARDAAGGLAAVHAAGFMHRDVKPGNILIAPDGTAKVADFGLARATARSRVTTLTGVAGTPDYMSPEQCWSEAADGRTDIYSLGATYYTLLTGRAPFLAANDMAVMYAHCNAAVPDPRSVVPDLPDGCAEVIRRAMAKQPADRHPTADALRADLDRVLAGELPPTRVLPSPPQLPPPTIVRPAGRTLLSRRAWLAAIPVTAVAVGAAAYLWPKPDAPGPEPGNGTVTPAPDPPVAWARRWEFPVSVVSLAVSPDGRRVAVTVAGPGDDRSKDAVDVRRPDGTSEPGWPKPLPGAEGVAFAPDGVRLAVASRWGGRVAVWDWAARDWADVDERDAVPGACAAAFSDDGTWLAIGSYVSTGARFRFWRADGRRWRLRHHLGTDECTVWGMGFVPGSARLVAAVGGTVADQSACAVRTFDPVAGAELPAPGLRLTRLENGPAAAVARRAHRVAVADGLVLGGRKSGGVRVYDLPEWAPVGGRLTFVGPDDSPDPWAVALSPDGTWVTAGANEDFYLWEVATGQAKPCPRGHALRVTALAFTPDGTKLLSGGEDGLVLIHDVAELTR